ncbi:MAG: hypothetical protein JSR17_13050 [Proteobacteria bacterium]|nr:hypothetical protein [Pseudomonadota bacterium]
MLKFIKRLRRGKKDAAGAQPVQADVPVQAVEEIPITPVAQAVLPLEIKQQPETKEAVQDKSPVIDPAPAPAKPVVERRRRKTAVQLKDSASDKVLTELNKKAKKLKKEAAKTKAVMPEELSFKEEIEHKSKAIRNRTHNHNKYYKGVGKDEQHLNGRPLVSVYEDENGEKLPAAQRIEKLRQVQAGKLKPWQ